VVALAALLPWSGAARQASPPPTCAVTWPADRAAIETCLRDCAVDHEEEVPIGVTKPKRLFLAAGSPVRSLAWKPLRPGRYSGYWESYKSEIAAYVMDKLFGLDMVPPVVERRYQGELGAAIFWVDGAKGWKKGETVDAPDAFAWARQVVRMKMFDQLIGNIDRNQGNLLYDADFHLILIDHSRAFTTTKDIRQEAQPNHIDAVLWDKIQALTLEDLQAALGDLLDKGQIKAILDRRDRMRAAIDTMVAARGASRVFIR
jgi:hypothetical protein